MGNYYLGQGSQQELVGVDSGMVQVVEYAIQITPVDFSVHDGLRILEEQREYVRTGVSTTMQSKHLTGDAVDLVPYINGRLRWEWRPIYQIAAAMHEAALYYNYPLIWGGVWDRILTDLPGDAESLRQEMLAYNERHPGDDFNDGPHFERAAV